MTCIHPFHSSVWSRFSSVAVLPSCSDPIALHRQPQGNARQRLSRALGAVMRVAPGGEDCEADEDEKVAAVALRGQRGIASAELA